MLELVLTRPDERSSLIKAAQGLQFLVLDELHTYRGRQGADVGMLVRRVREACGAHETLQCIGTSATMSSGGTVAEQQRDVAAVASRIFGTEVQPDHVITETLVRATTEPGTDPDLAAAVQARGPAEAKDPALDAGLRSVDHDPLASWIEDTFGVTEEPDSGAADPTPPQHRRPRQPRDLAELTGTPTRRSQPRSGRHAAGGVTHQGPRDSNGRCSPSGCTSSSPRAVRSTPPRKPVDTARIEGDYQVVLPGEPERRLYPLAFCRECGQEYLMATRDDTDDRRHRQGPARPATAPEDGDGYLFISET